MPSKSGALGLLLLLAGLPGQAEARRAAPVEELVVVGSSLSAGTPAERLPAQVRTLEVDLQRPGVEGVNAALARRFGGADEIDTLGSSLQQTLSLRGFVAAPALGEPQGVTVYQDGMRANEAFGDVVQWDLLPTFAVGKAQVIAGSNPVYGLNTTGGVVALSMKDGFTAPGNALEFTAGSFGRRGITAQAGGSRGDIGVYLGLDALDEDGWRDASPGWSRRGYLDLAWRGPAGAKVGLGVTAAETRLTGNGAVPADLLAARREAVFTYPDETDTKLLAANLRAAFNPVAGLSFGGGAYARHLDRATRNGDQAEFEECEDFVGLVPGFDAPDDSLCFGAELEDADEVEGEPEIVVDRAGQAITQAEDADAVFNRTRTRTNSWGLNGQVTWRASPGGRQNILIAGGAYDRARTRYSSGTSLGELEDDRGVEDLGFVIGNREFNVGLRTESRSTGLYVSDTFSLTPDLHLSGSARWNRTDLALRDQIGTALNGDHRFERLNLGGGLAWSPSRALTVYGSVARNSRAPTPAELSCADPETPCRFPNAFLADPPLDEVKALTVETGARGRFDNGLGRGRWSAALFRTDLADDILFISAGPIVGTGYFANVGDTRRQGLDLDVQAELGPVRWFASYAYVQATYRAAFEIQAPHNPRADNDGEIAVRSGDRMPAIPEHSFKAGIDWSVTEALTLGLDLRVTSERYLRGDEANLTAPLDGFALVGASASWTHGPVELWGRVSNLLDEDYATFGLYGDADELGFDSPRFLSPGAPRSVVVGVRARF